MAEELAQAKKILTIAGSDILSGGGMQADLATFAANGLYGFCALTSIVTVKEDKFFVHPVDEEIFQEELESLTDIDFSAIKIGLLPNKKILEMTKKWLTALSVKSPVPIILDPVIVFKENADYSVSEMRELFISQLFPLATVITPNLKEAEILTGLSVKTEADMKFDQKQAIDFAYDGKDFYQLASPLLKKNNNGAGCTFASSIASQMAEENSFKDSVEKAKDFVYQAIQNSNEFGVFQNKK